MHNTFVEEQVNTFECGQRERQAARYRMAKSIDAEGPNRWAQVRSILQRTLAHITALARFRERAAARESL